MIVYDFTRFTWILFLSQKEETIKFFVKFVKLIQNLLDFKVVTLRSDHGGECINHQYESFCNKNGIAHNFSCPHTQQQNGVVERKNRVLEELARIMISEMGFPKYFWVDSINTACRVLNRMLIRPILEKTTYDLLKGRKPNIYYQSSSHTTNHT